MGPKVKEATYLIQQEHFVKENGHQPTRAEFAAYLKTAPAPSGAEIVAKVGEMAQAGDSVAKQIQERIKAYFLKQTGLPGTESPGSAGTGSSPGASSDQPKPAGPPSPPMRHGAPPQAAAPGKSMTPEERRKKILQIPTTE